MPKLTVQNAEIKTAAVEVRTLTLSGKQVTLSVFKQIEQAPIIQEDGALAGEPWGRVNYHPDKCADLGAHHHVVWQLGSELRRAAHASPLFGAYWSQTSDDFLTSAVLEFLRGKPHFFADGKLPAQGQYGHVQRIAQRSTINGIPVDLNASELAVKAYAESREVARVDNPAGREPTRAWSTPGADRSANDWPAPAEPARPHSGPSAYDRANERFAAVITQLDAQVSGFGATAAELQARLHQELHVEAARRIQHQASWQLLCDLPQLFIAV
jgi:hypothetical protein